MALITGGLRSLLARSLFAVLCTGAVAQDKPAKTEQKAASTSNDTKGGAAKSETVSEPGKSVMYVFQP